MLNNCDGLRVPGLTIQSQFIPLFREYATSSEYQVDMATSLKPLKVIYWTISGKQQPLRVIASPCLVSLTLQRDFVPPLPLSLCASLASLGRAHRSALGEGTSSPFAFTLPNIHCLGPLGVVVSVILKKSNK